MKTRSVKRVGFFLVCLIVIVGGLVVGNSIVCSAKGNEGKVNRETVSSSINESNVSRLKINSYIAYDESYYCTY